MEHSTKRIHYLALQFLLLGLTLPASAQLEGPGCEPGSRILCTPNQASITATGNAAFHVVLPANKRRAVTFPNTGTALVQVINRRGVVCWDPALPCVSSSGSGTVPVRDIRFQPDDFLNPNLPAGALVWKIEGDTTIFAVNDRDNDGAFADNTGYFEFDVSFVSRATVEETTTWVKRNAMPLRTVEAGNGFDDLQPLKTLIGNARIVSLGEATHGTREFFQMKHRLMEFLATEMGFTIFSIEANMPESYRMNDYVLNGNGDPKAILRGMYFWTWQTEEVLAMVEWMRQFNASGKGRVQFTGFDMQTPDVAITVARDFIAKAEPEYVPEINRVLGEVPRLSTTAVQGFGVASSTIPIAEAAGKRIRYQGWIKTSGITTGYAGLWLRVDRGAGFIFLDNMSNRGANGTRDWTRYEINATVPADATGVVFGVLHPGNGTAWFDSLSIEIDGVPYNDTNRFDLDFESSTVRGFGLGGAGFSLQLDAGESRTGRQSLRSHYLNTPTMTAAEAVRECAAVVDHMRAARPGYLAAGFSASETDWAIRNARVVCQVAELRADPTGRDRAMAENIAWILDQNPGAKIVLWAHNGHVAAGSYRGYVPMGSYLWEKYSTDMIAVGFAFHRGGFQAIDGQGRGLIPFTVPAAHADTLDSLYASAKLPIYAIDLRKAPLTGPGALLRSPLLTRTIGSLYDERIPLLYFSEVAVPDAFDAMIFVEETTRAQPIR